MIGFIALIAWIIIFNSWVVYQLYMIRTHATEVYEDVEHLKALLGEK